MYTACGMNIEHRIEFNLFCGRILCPQYYIVGKCDNY